MVENAAEFFYRVQRASGHLVVVYASLTGLGRWIGLMERDSKRIVREWNREIEADMRRLAAQQDEGRWKIVVWVVLWVAWLTGLVAIFGLLQRAHW